MLVVKLQENKARVTEQLLEAFLVHSGQKLEMLPKGNKSYWSDVIHVSPKN